MMYNDNRDVPVKIKECVRYHERIESTVKAFRKRVKAPARVADIGCRDGYSVKLLKKKGYSVIGTDIVQGFVDHAQERGRKVVWDDMMECDLPSEWFDAVFSRHCVEHCRDTRVFLEQCIRITKPGGIVFLTFPLETKEAFGARDFPGKNHMVYFAEAPDFLKVSEQVGLETVFCGKCAKIIPDGEELLYIGRCP